MKKFLTVGCVFVLGVFAVAGLILNKHIKTEEGYLRIHIRANSNCETDQNVKYIVKESVTQFLTPLVAEAKTANEAMKIVNENLCEISAVATKTLHENGLSYNASAKLTEEWFPTRSYNSVVLENGYYDALIINLGTGEGDNWWCVVYPPLCFLGGGTGNDVTYKSILYDILRKR